MLSAVLIVKNEEKNIRPCLESLEWVDEIVIVDGNSADKTVEIAKEFGAKVFYREMDTEGKQRNFAVSKASHDWILIVDADERVTPELKEEILETLKNPTSDVYAVPFRNFIGKRFVPYGWGCSFGVSKRISLFRKGCFTRDEEGLVHTKSTITGTVGELQNSILHYGYRDYNYLIDSVNRYSDLRAVELYREGKAFNWFTVTRRAIHRSFKSFVSRKGYKSGVDGLMIALCCFLYIVLSYAKYEELKISGGNFGKGN